MQEPNPEVHECLARLDLEHAPISAAERGLLRFSEIITRNAYKTTDQDVQTLRDLGWSDPEIAESVYITALFGFFNRVADAFGLSDPHYFADPPSWWSRPDEPPA